jgi:hypothetical protein
MYGTIANPAEEKTPKTPPIADTSKIGKSASNPEKESAKV